ncbi:hypothetical protein REPUB_Repub03eG0148400 [Reevesia pubescens]
MANSIEDVFRYWRGTERQKWDLIFSKSIGIADSNHAEFLAINEAFVIFAASKWVKTHGLLNESDSLNPVNWFKQPSSTPRRLKKHIPFVESLKSELISWQVLHVLRESNDIADGLAKSGVNRNNALLLML